MNKGDVISFKANQNTGWSVNAEKWSSFHIYGNDVKVYGNPKSLTNNLATGKYCGMFTSTYWTSSTGGTGSYLSGVTIVDAKGVIISGNGDSGTTADWCYSNMFSNCRYLTAAPDLYCKGLSVQCYDQMFLNCSALSTAPKMYFYTVEQYSCREMFKGCTSLTGVVLPNLGNWSTTDSFDKMFEDCSSLSSIEINSPYYWSSSRTTNWVKGVANNGVFIKPASVSDMYDGYNYIPLNWTVINK